MAELSPMMKQYMSVKEQYQDCILFFRLGDFYEMFFEDAITASRELELTLTGRDCGQEDRAPMCGVPFHSAETYIAKLIEKGYKVAICEQLEEPSQAKGIVRRDVIRVITPGTVIEANMLDDKKNNYIMCICKTGLYIGLSACDVSTGEIYATQITEGQYLTRIIDEIAKFNPNELIVNSEIFSDEELINILRQRFNIYITRYDDNKVEHMKNMKIILDSNDISNEEYNLAKESTNLLLNYLSFTQKIELIHLNTVNIYEKSSYMTIDFNTRRNLELVETLREKKKKGTLLWVLDKTRTSMGGRLLRKWIENPLVNINDIQYRQDAIEDVKEKVIVRSNMYEILNFVYDIERLSTKIVYGNINAKDMISLKNSIQQLPKLKQEMFGLSSKYMKEILINFDTLNDIKELIENAIVEEPPLSIKDGEIIKDGYNSTLDEYRKATNGGKKWIVELEQKEKELTGIKNLKTGYNKIFGYYFEVTKSYFDMIPERYIRKQTLANCERLITPELKEIEEKILEAQDKIVDLEYQLFVDIRNQLFQNINRLKKAANIVAVVDCIISLAIVAEKNNYVRPIVNLDDKINIKNGRHPVIEEILPSGMFVQNDTLLDINSNRFNIITGPNMAGKSTYMRQVALIVLMAQVGSFVPADEANIGIVDKIFTRVGASDDLASGQSTFMVEMIEVANILNNATNRSLIILDEIGRGTSTFDGLSIAWSVVEYIADKEKIGARTLFATHYHELTELEGKIEGVKNYSIAVKDKGEQVIFLRKIVEGGTDKSYGIHVAKIAGVPTAVIKNANRILKELEETDITKKEFKSGNKVKDLSQYDLFNYKVAQISDEIKKLDLNEITPFEALNILNKFKEKLD